MSKFVTPVFVVAAGHARIVTLANSIEGDQFAVMYRPDTDATSSAPFIQLPVQGSTDGSKVIVSHENPLALAVLPGSYRLEAISEPSPDAHLNVTDGSGFPFQLGRSV